MNKTKSNKKKSCGLVITPQSGNRTRHATPALFAPVSRCVRFFGAGCSPSPCKGFDAVFGSFFRLFGGRKSKLDKDLGSPPRLRQATSARSAGSFKEPRSSQKWGQKQRRNKILRSLSRSAYAHKKKPGVNPKKGDHYEPKREIRPLPDTGWSGVIRRTAAAVSPGSSRTPSTSIWTISAPTAPVCSCRPRCSPIWTAGWINWKIAWRRCSTSSR